MRREVVMTGIGGQGIQLAAQVLARGALGAGLHAQLFGSYGGMMRGGNTEATVVISDLPVMAPPTVGSAWSGFVMHHDYSEGAISRLRPDSIVLVDSTVFDGELPAELARVMRVPATAWALEAGRKQVASMVLLGAFVSATQMYGLTHLQAAVAQALPSYRGKLVDLNRQALQLGFERADSLVHDLENEVVAP